MGIQDDILEELRKQNATAESQWQTNELRRIKNEEDQLKSEIRTYSFQKDNATDEIFESGLKTAGAIAQGMVVTPEAQAALKPLSALFTTLGFGLFALKKQKALDNMWTNLSDGAKNHFSGNAGNSGPGPAAQPGVRNNPPPGIHVS